MTSAAQQAYAIGVMADKLPEPYRTAFFRNAFDIFKTGRISLAQIDELKRIYGKLEKETR